MCCLAIVVVQAAQLRAFRSTLDPLRRISEVLDSLPPDPAEDEPAQEEVSFRSVLLPPPEDDQDDPMIVRSHAASFAEQELGGRLRSTL